MKQATCWIVYLTIESATQTVLDAVGKKITIEHLRQLSRRSRTLAWMFCDPSSRLFGGHKTIGHEDDSFR